MTRTTTSAEETQRLGEEVARTLRLGDVLLLTGELGTGKTTFVQGLVRGLGATEAATSPSFILIHEYSLPRGVFRHLDVYRLPDPAVDLDRIGLPELVNDTEAITAIEWADRLPALPHRGNRSRAIHFKHGRQPSERIIELPVGL